MTHQMETHMATKSKPAAKNEPTLKDICKDLGISPVAARRKLRKAWRSKDTKIAHAKRQQWSGAWVREVLKPAKGAK